MSKWFYQLLITDYPLKEFISQLITLEEKFITNPEPRSLKVFSWSKILTQNSWPHYDLRPQSSRSWMWIFAFFNSNYSRITLLCSGHLATERTFSKILIYLNFWCGQRDLNSHGLSPHGPQPCLSTNFSMTAFIS